MKQAHFSINAQKETAFDAYLNDVHRFAQTLGGQGPCIDAMTLLAVLLQDKKVQAFIADQCDQDENWAQRIADSARNAAADRILLASRTQTQYRTASRQNNADAAPPPAAAKVSLSPALRAGFDTFASINQDLENKVEIFVALLTSQTLSHGFGSESPTSSILGATSLLGLGPLHSAALLCEYGMDDPRQIFQGAEIYCKITGKPLAIPTQNALACVRGAERLVPPPPPAITPQIMGLFIDAPEPAL